MADATPGSAAPSSNRTVMIVLSYLWLLALIPLLTEKEDKEVQWHAKHGIVLMVAELGFWIVLTIIQTATLFIGCIAGIFGLFAWLAIIVLHIMCIVKGVNGQRLVIPGVSQFAEKF